MRIVRSWVAEPGRHPRVIDDCERVNLENFDYSPLAKLDDDIIQLDWDTAVGREELRAFAAKCKAEPDLVRVAPCREHNTRMYKNHLVSYNKPIWNVWLADKNNCKVDISPGDPVCNIFGFGLVYLPGWTLKQYLEDEYDAPIQDISFSFWYYRKIGIDVPVEWDTHIVHVNYSMQRALDER